MYLYIKTQYCCVVKVSIPLKSEGYVRLHSPIYVCVCTFLHICTRNRKPLNPPLCACPTTCACAVLTCPMQMCFGLF